jgi:hypothetical protein
LPLQQRSNPMNAIIRRLGEDFPHCPAGRGYAVVYREDQVNFCPGCGRSHWYVGRLLAECAYCGTAVPLSETNVQAGAWGHSRNRRAFVPSELAA